MTLRARSPLALACLLASALLGSAGCGRQAARAAGSGDSVSSNPNSNQVVAEVAGQKITLGELDQRARGRLESVRYEEYEARRQTLDQMVVDRLIDREAAARHVSRDALIKAEVDDKVAKPSEDELRKLYQRYQSQTGGVPFEDLRSRMEASVLQQRRAERDAAFRDELQAKANVRVLLPQPRTTVEFPDNAPFLGPKKAPITIVEFLDYQCPYCHRAQDVVDQVLKKYEGKVRFVHRDYILGKPRSLAAARAAHCAGEQGRFWEFHRDLLVREGDMSDQDLERRAAAHGLDPARLTTCAAAKRYDDDIQGSTRYGSELGISGTPTFFVNGRRMVGARTLKDFETAIEEELAGAP